MTALSFHGVFTALVTPFTEDGSAIDFDAYRRLLETQIEAKVAGVVPCGTTGESPTLTSAEQIELIRFTKRVVKNQLPVLAGAGSNATQKSVEGAKAALDAGADAVMIVMPYYNKPSQTGLIRHIEQIAAAVSAPIVLYNIPTRSVVELSVPSVLAVLESCPNVMAVKDATGGLGHCQELLSRSGDRVAVLSGDDALALPMMALGAAGVISVASNLYPKAVVRLVDAAKRGDFAAARKEHFKLLPVFKALFEEPSPAPIKAALASQGWMHGSLRLPMAPVTPECQKRLLAVLKTYDEAAGS
ncbi:MAG TPA: 4-hydroxy-tetrahydrodipicolinate synthase [Polyangiaceae bacterium]|nr:4-hydroxy-tetrahydrodipicolinate synthase [Polyangiaceae bacterium]